MSFINGQLTSKSGYLPTEVLSKVFQECLVLDDMGLVAPCPHQAPLILTWVCRLWRSIALNTHRLWQGITLLREAHRTEDSRQLLELWISRSGALPFGIRVMNVVREEDGMLVSLQGRTDNDNASLNDDMKSLIDTLLKCSERWRVLEVTLPDVTFATPLLDAVSTKAQGLEHLSISLQYLGINDPPYRYDFSQTIALKSVHLLAPPILPFPNANNQSFANLVDLELHFSPCLENCLTWLDMTPNLESLVLRVLSNGQRMIFQPGRHIRRLPHLESLEITCFAANSQADNPAALLDMLDIPNLIDLELDLNHFFDESPFRMVRDLFARSGVSLDRLCLSGTHMSEGEIVECLRLSPDLAWFECEIVSDVILQALTPRLRPDLDDTALNPTRSNPEADIEMDKKAGNATEDQDDNKDKSKELDPSRYDILCPNLEYFEAVNVDVCSPQAIYAMAASRCEDVYEGIKEYVDLGAIRPTPDVFKTLHSIVLPCDPIYGVLSHPQILDSYDRTVYF